MLKNKWEVYVCPNCNKEQTSICQWQTISACYEIQLKEKTTELTSTEGGDHEAWCCPECKEEIPNKVVELLNVFKSQRRRHGQNKNEKGKQRING